VVRVVITVFSPELCGTDVEGTGTTADEIITSVPNVIGAEEAFDVKEVDTLDAADMAILDVAAGGPFKPFGSIVTVSYTTPVTVKVLCDVHIDDDEEVASGVKVDDSGDS